MKYKVGDKFTIEMPSGGYREMFGYEKDLDGMIITE